MSVEHLLDFFACPIAVKFVLVRPELTAEVKVTYWVELLQFRQSFIIACRQLFRAHKFVGLAQVPSVSTFLRVFVLLRVTASTRFGGMLFTFLADLGCV